MSAPRHPHQTGTFFLTIVCAKRRTLFQTDANARLLFNTLQHYRKTHYALHAFVIMPEHLHLILTPRETLERAVQCVKGGFSYRYSADRIGKADVWQRGYTDHRIRDRDDLERRQRYLEQNPVARGLCAQPEEHIWSSASAVLRKQADLSG